MSETEVVAGGVGAGFEWSDVAVDEDVEVTVAGLGDDALEQYASLGGGSGMAGAQEWEVIRSAGSPEARPRSRMITPTW